MLGGSHHGFLGDLEKIRPAKQLPGKACDSREHPGILVTAPINNWLMGTKQQLDSSDAGKLQWLYYLKCLVSSAEYPNMWFWQFIHITK